MTRQDNTGNCADVLLTDNSWFDDGRSYDEWNDDWSSVGWREGWEERCVNSTGSFFLSLSGRFLISVMWAVHSGLDGRT